MPEPAGSAPGWRPVADVDIARLRASMLDAARHYFAAEEILLVDTPALSTHAVSDPNIDSVEARLELDPGVRYFLHTSPEYHMKRLLAAGFPDIGQVCRVFRDGESGNRHQPEFTLLEWYRRGFDLDSIIRDTERMLERVLGGTCLCSKPVRLSYRDAFLRYADLDPLHAETALLAERVDADTDLRAALGNQRDAWLDLVMATIVAPAFEPDRLTCVSHYPASQAALARLCPSNPALADRFEMYCGNIELANGYVELTDGSEQRRRFELDRHMRRENGRPPGPIDTLLLEALDAGLPECAGVAVGFDRLLMIRAGRDDIRQIQHFPHEGGR